MHLILSNKSQQSIPVITRGISVYPLIQGFAICVLKYCFDLGQINLHENYNYGGRTALYLTTNLMSGHDHPNKGVVFSSQPLHRLIEPLGEICGTTVHTVN